MAVQTQAPPSIAHHRDALAARVSKGAVLLEQLDPADPRYAATLAKWADLDAEYQARCREQAEPASTHCTACGQPSPNGLTPCARCCTPARAGS